MSTIIRNRQLAAIVAELGILLHKEVPAPIKSDYDAVMRVKDSLKEFQYDTLIADDNTEREAAISLAYTRLQTFEAFHEQNGHKWAARPLEELLALGGEVRIDEMLAYYPNSFAQKELPVVCKALCVYNMDQLARHSKSDIAGPQSRNCGNKTLDWIDFVCKKLGLVQSKHKSAA
jgi:hypothetical protein